ncbi:hypothetical protein B0H16DRAFT_1744800 [Mycena metata]|uniref:Integrase catalytic domain-containing protein n=1 Tax=Mycena metata TaxID=1033252 RepID=A0AAD7H409_9AGAR|nr:hypothetical protein B0H16DRAFT_1744800 [Mycena metata]
MRIEAEREHREGGHLGRDSMKLKLTDRFKTPAIDKILLDAIQNCGECLNFGSTHLHALLQPITRRHPFELLVGDYLAMPKGKGGYKETHGSAVTTKAALNTLFTGYAPWETFQTDGGSHFDNADVRQLCGKFGVKTHVVAKYSPALDHTPNELFFAMVINTAETGVQAASDEISMDDIDVQHTYATQQRFDGYARAVKHGVARKAAFDRRVLDSKAGEVIFAPGDLVQVLDPKYKKTYLTSKKILPEWSGAFRVKERLLNSYIIETIYEEELAGEYNSRHLRPLEAPKGSSLEAYETARRARMTSGETQRVAEPVVLEEPEPSREEESAAREADGRRQQTDEEEEVEEKEAGNEDVA